MNKQNSINETERLRKTNYHKVIYFSLCFTMLFTSYCAAVNLMSQIYSEMGFQRLGAFCFFCISLTFTLSSSLGSHYLKKMSPKTVLILSPALHVSFILAGLFSTACRKYEIESAFCSTFSIYLINIISGILMGAFASFLWIYQSIYVNACADEETKGLFNGTFLSIFQCAQLLSGLLATIVLASTDSFVFYMMLALFGSVSVVMFTFVPSPSQRDTTTVQQENVQETSVGDYIKLFAGLFQEKQYYYLFMTLFFSGAAIGGYINFLGAYVAAIVDAESVNKSIGMVLIVLAIGEISAGYSMGRLADMYDKLKLFTGTMMINEAALLVSLLAILLQSFPLALVCGFLWGYGETSIQTMICVIIGAKFNGRQELYSAYRFIQGAGMVYSSILAMLIPRTTPLLYIMVMGATFAVFHIYHAIYLPKSDEKNDKLLEANVMVELKNL